MQAKAHPKCMHTEVMEWIEHSILHLGCKFQGSRAVHSVERKKLQKHVERTPIV